MVAQYPCVVAELSEQIDEEFPLVVVGLGGALVEVADIDEDGIRVLFAPSANLRGAAGEASDIAGAGVGGGGEDVAVEVGGVEDGNGFKISGF